MSENKHEVKDKNINKEIKVRSLSSDQSLLAMLERTGQEFRLLGSDREEERE